MDPLVYYDDLDAGLELTLVAPILKFTKGVKYTVVCGSFNAMTQLYLVNDHMTYVPVEQFLMAIGGKAVMVGWVRFKSSGVSTAA